MLDLVYLKAINLGPLKFLEEKDLGRLLRKCGHLLRSLTVVSSDITGESLGQAEQTRQAGGYHTTEMEDTCPKGIIDNVSKRIL